MTLDGMLTNFAQKAERFADAMEAFFDSEEKPQTTTKAHMTVRCRLDEAALAKLIAGSPLVFRARGVTIKLTR